MHAQLDGSDGETAPVLPRRLRHITSIQIRNLTPFPARDQLASALTQPAEQPQFLSNGHLADDLDLGLAQKRSRRISTNSISTLRSVKSDESAVALDGLASSHVEAKARPRNLSHTSLGSIGQRPTGSAPTIRPHRARTTSVASGNSSLISGALFGQQPSNITSSIPAFSTVKPDNSQSGLERVIRSRLVETFLAISVPPSVKPELPTPASPRVSSPPTSPHGRFPSKGSNHLSRHSVIVPKPSSSSHSRQASLAITKTEKHSLPSPSQSPPPETSTIPDYLSPIHPSSTNPCFSFEPRSDLPSWIDSSGERLNVEVWAKLVPDTTKSPDPDHGRKGKEKAHKLDWQVLKSWDLSLAQLVPVPDDRTQLPPNSIVLTISPPGGSFYLPDVEIPDTSVSRTDGSSSDPESAVRKITRTNTVQELTRARRRTRKSAQDAINPQEQLGRTASWQDLFKLSNLQIVVADTQASLKSIVSGIDKSLEGDSFFAMRRELKMREYGVDQIRVNCKSVKERCQKLECDIALRRELLRQRKEMLTLAYGQHDHAITSHLEVQTHLNEERLRTQTLRNRFPPTRTTLLSALASIFPIDLLSSPDLLFTILDVPLPIPSGSNDPAPPLSIPTHKEVNEETIATALGYAAQLLQLLAAYLGKRLVYPVTCIGSRSLIRDGISAMVGPRMFPLYCKGVDTYRFEYGVFLLNKDIESLMSEYDLRALDMRHTLPNLKNLLLTLTSGEGAELMPPRVYSPVHSTVGLESPKNEAPPPLQTPDTPKPSQTLELPAVSTTPPDSGSTTPTTTPSDAAKKGRPFLGLSFGSGFLRGRYPSLGSTVKTEDFPTPREDGSDGGDEDDRRTLREPDTEAATVAEGEKADSRLVSASAPPAPVLPA